MTPRSLQAVLRKLAEAPPQASDEELLHQFLDGEEAAFAELVRRHGRLVWTVCRHLTGSDAEADDAFQATFLVLLKKARTIRDSGRLSSWLHGVAYKVCAKARLAAKRRTTRERATAASESNGHAVADSAWDRALAAVHEEAAKLPEALRVPFVLCCLEGKGVSEAAEQLGWKLGTLSGRLTRAKDAVLAKLETRGLTLGVVAGLGLAAPPATAVAKTIALAQVGFVIPVSVLQLTQGVIGMSMKSVKLLAAALVVTCGLGLGVGKSLIATAEAQGPAQPQNTKPRAEEELKRLKAELEALKQAQEQQSNDARAAQKEALRATDLLREAQKRQAIEVERAALDAIAAAKQTQKSASGARTSKWEYDFVAIGPMEQSKFVALLNKQENAGWEFTGTAPMIQKGQSGTVGVFRRPVKSSNAYRSAIQEYYKALELPRSGDALARAADEFKKLQLEKLAFDRAQASPDEAKAIEADIAKLKARLAELKGKGNISRVTFGTKDLPMEPAELAELLLKLAGKKFKNAHYTFTPGGPGLIIEGDKEVIDWATAMIKKLGEK